MYACEFMSNLKFKWLHQLHHQSDHVCIHDSNNVLFGYLFIKAHFMLMYVESNTNNFHHIECAISESFKQNILESKLFTSNSIVSEFILMQVLFSSKKKLPIAGRVKSLSRCSFQFTHRVLLSLVDLTVVVILYMLFGRWCGFW